jgi:heme exporter protein B
MEIYRLRLMLRSWYIFEKDLRQEFKSRYALNAIILFSVITVVAVSFSIGTFSASAEIKSALLWIILFFSAMSGLAHVFVREEEKHTADTLKLVTDSTSIFLGKFFFNFFLLLFLDLIVVILFFAFMNFKVAHTGIFLSVLLLGSTGLAAGATLIAAIVAKASAKGALFTVLSFPVLLPVLIAGINGTKIAVTSDTFLAAGSEVQVLFAFSVVIITASLLLFDFVWNE